MDDLWYYSDNIDVYNNCDFGMTEIFMIGVSWSFVAIIAIMAFG